MRSRVKQSPRVQRQTHAAVSTTPTARTIKASQNANHDKVETIESRRSTVTILPTDRIQGSI